jgi:hypothetical protein
MKNNYEIIVVGGGFAGVAAALAAAREGRRVLIVEKGNSLGGAAVHALVNPFMSMTPRIQDGGTLRNAYGGLFKTIHDKLRERNAIQGQTGALFLEEELKLILNEMVLEAGIELLFHAYLFAAHKEGEKISSVSVASKSGVIELEADYFVDASGDAQLAYLAGCPTTLGREGDNLCQPMTLCFRIGNVDMEKYHKSEPRLAEAHKKALAEGRFINPRENILAFNYPTDNVLHMNTTRVVKLDPTSPEDVTKAEIIARRQVFQIYDFMKQNADGLENSFLMMTAAEIGVRESRMIVGDYVLTESDCTSLTVFDDAVCACNYAIDIHNPEGTGTTYYSFPHGKYYTIPYRSLIPKTVENMLVAGRCISSDHGAQSSYRIMPSVCCIGEAAGAAIGMAARDGISVRDINVEELQSVLKTNGAFIGKQ